MRKWMIVLSVFGALPLWAGVQGDLRQGGQLYEQKKYGQALTKYNEILKEHPSNQEAALGAGASAYYLKDYGAAESAFSHAADQNTPRQADAFFNLGNAYYRAQDTQKAQQAYRQAILKNPQDKEAIHNLQIILEEKQNKQNNDNQNDKNEQNDSSNQQPQNGQDPQKGDNQQEQNGPSQADKDAADRVMQMAQQQENRQQQQSSQGRKGTADNLVEKDW